MFNRGYNELRNSWEELNKSRKDFIITLLNYIGDKITPRWLNYLLTKKELKNRKEIENPKGAIDTVNYLYKKRQLSEKQRDKLVDIINKIPVITRKVSIK